MPHHEDQSKFMLEQQPVLVDRIIHSRLKAWMPPGLRHGELTTKATKFTGNLEGGDSVSRATFLGSAPYYFKHRFATSVGVIGFAFQLNC